VPILIVLLLIVLTVVALIPISIVQRYRMGTSRQRARGWLAVINIVGLALSCVIVLVSAAFSNIWVPHALAYTAAGLGGGMVLGILGLALTRWERRPGTLHYTPNRWLVLAITLVITARLTYGFLRVWHTWRVGVEDGSSFFAAAGVADSMAAGAVVLGYYLAYWIGVRSHIRKLR
jgi:hypothetical protein